MLSLVLSYMVIDIVSSDSAWRNGPLGPGSDVLAWWHGPTTRGTRKGRPR
jgi:hypothetical protein